eukprot:TRINITY_DN24420_c0_g1_i1.p1 TRINITY_DN24420_c0_g1~~TRINITY_DN24420_c0_g1_i1.p1  ORF type:complete len:301 (+),score=89.48 TRINITY_DN24420_c0_g1_i1:55-957(+)
MFRRVVIGCDHAAPKARAEVVEQLNKMGLEVVDCGVHTTDRVDYPDVASEVCKKVLSEENSCGVLICGSGIGMSISANKMKGIRAAVCHDQYTAMMCREHNNCNVLCMGARTSGPAILSQMVDTFLATEFAGGRHADRVAKIMTEKPTFEPAKDSDDDVLVFGCDHAAYEEKAVMVEYAKSLGKKVVDMGTHTADRVDYPDIATAVCAEVIKTGGKGVLICGSGIGMAITASKFSGVRAALCHEAYTAKMCRLHNNANVLCMGARTSGPDLHKEMLNAYLTTSFEGGRHAGRVDKMTALE